MSEDSETEAQAETEAGSGRAGVGAAARVCGSRPGEAEGAGADRPVPASCCGRDWRFITEKQGAAVKICWKRRERARNAVLSGRFAGEQ